MAQTARASRTASASSVAVAIGGVALRVDAATIPSATSRSVLALLRARGAASARRAVYAAGCIACHGARGFSRPPKGAVRMGSRADRDKVAFRSDLRAS